MRLKKTDREEFPKRVKILNPQMKIGWMKTSNLYRKTLIPKHVRLRICGSVWHKMFTSEVGA